MGRLTTEQSAALWNRLTPRQQAAFLVAYNRYKENAFS